jgi:hypothetical protein
VLAALNLGLPAEPPPGGGNLGLLTTDDAVAFIFLKSLLAGTLMFRLQNYGPAALPGVNVMSSCSFISYSYSDGSELGGGSSGIEVTLNLAVGQSVYVEAGTWIDPKKTATRSLAIMCPTSKIRSRPTTAWPFLFHPRHKIMKGWLIMIFREGKNGK